MVFGVTVGLAACDLSTPEIASFETGRRSYAPSDEVTLRLRNTSDVVLGYNLCFAVLEGRTPSGWARVPGAEQTCTAQLEGLPPGAQAQQERPLPTRAGTHRFALAVELPGDVRQTLYTPAFEVGGR